MAEIFRIRFLDFIFVELIIFLDFFFLLDCFRTSHGSLMIGLGSGFETNFRSRVCAFAWLLSVRV